MVRFGDGGNNSAHFLRAGIAADENGTGLFKQTVPTAALSNASDRKFDRILIRCRRSPRPHCWRDRPRLLFQTLAGQRLIPGQSNAPRHLCRSGGRGHHFQSTNQGFAMHGTITKHCRVCSKPFQSKRASAEFCGSSCRSRFRRHPGWYPALSVASGTPHHFPSEGPNRGKQNQSLSIRKNGLSVAPTYCSDPGHVIEESLGIVWRVVAGPPVDPFAVAEMGPLIGPNNRRRPRSETWSTLERQPYIG